MTNPTLDSQKIIDRRNERSLTQISEKLALIESSFPTLSPEEEGFVRARASYLTKEQRALFAPLFRKVKEEE